MAQPKFILHTSYLILLFLTACSSTPTPPAAEIIVPTVAEAAVALTATPTDIPLIPTNSPVPPLLSPTFTPTFTPSPIPVGAAVDPNILRSTATATIPPNVTPPTPEFVWRPPTMPVPLSIHPDDHYWFARPIPSGSRNYDLEWYPYGNDILIPRLGSLRVHHGLDFPNEPGTPVLAAGSGTVIWAGTRPSPRDGIDYYGNTIIIEHDWQWEGQPVFTLYAHTLEMFVEEGDRVETGQLLAGVGGSGIVTGPHLHFEIRIGRNHYFNARNPALWLSPYEGWGTLAGRFVDKADLPISNATITVKPLFQSETAVIRSERTYMDRRLPADENWNENFAISDLPAGKYEVTITMPLVEDSDGIQENVLVRRFTDTIEIYPGRTNFLVVQADFYFVPTPTPTPTITPLPSATPTGTLTISSTIGITDTIGITNTLGISETSETEDQE